MPPPARKRRAPVDDDVPTTQTQRSRRQEPDPDPEDEEVSEEEQDNGSGSLGALSKSFVRYALACEYSRIPIRRQDVNQKVLGSHSRAFKQVFDAANGQLLEVFGMEMVELPNKERVTTRQKRAAAASESQPKNSNQWILRNALPAEFRTSDIIAPAQVPTSDLESAYVGLYTMIVSLILLSGGSLPESRLDRYLKRMNAEQSTPVDSTDKVLARMIKEGYIVKIKDNQGGEDMVDYMVGPRGKVEVGDEGVANLVRSMYSDGTMADLEQRLTRSLGLSENGAPSQLAANGEGAAAAQGGGRRVGRPRRRGSEDE